MKKKILGLLMTFLFIFTISINSVSAEVLTWDTILTDYKKIIENEKFVITSDDTSLNISYPEFKYGPYSIKFNYDDINKKISYISTRDTSNFTDEQMVNYGSADLYFISMLMIDLFKLNNIDMEKMSNLEETDDTSQYGIILDSKQVSYVAKDENGEEIGTKSIEYTNNFIVDLNKFDQATASLQNTITDSTYYDTMIMVFKSLLNPTEGIFNSDIELDWELGEGVIDETTNSNTQQIEKEVVKEDTTTEKNPQTGIEKIGISVILIGLISFLVYIIVKNKKVFTK